MKTLIPLFLLLALLWLPACESSGGGSSDTTDKTSGSPAASTVTPATVENKCPTTHQSVGGRTGYDCLLQAAADGREAEWDFVQNTVEGDPIVIRYQLRADGRLRIITDNSRDAFGGSNRGVSVEDCGRLSAAEIFPPIGDSCRIVTDHGIGPLTFEPAPPGNGGPAEPLPGDVSDSSDLAERILGQNQDVAEAQLSDSGLPWRYVSIDGQSLGVTLDLVPGRLNLYRNQGRITSVEVEGGPTLRTR